jgi:hypothetical protein
MAIELSQGALDFNRFRSDVLTPDSYVELAKDLYDAECADDLHPYMSVYETVNDICKEQHSIVDGGIDVSVLPSLFIALPRLTELRLSFLEALGEQSWVLSSLTPDIVMEKEPYESHIRVVSNAIQSARKRGVVILATSLLEFDLPHYHPQRST